MQIKIQRTIDDWNKIDKIYPLNMYRTLYPITIEHIISNIRGTSLTKSITMNKYIRIDIQPIGWLQWNLL